MTAGLSNALCLPSPQYLLLEKREEFINSSLYLGACSAARVALRRRSLRAAAHLSHFNRTTQNPATGRMTHAAKAEAARSKVRTKRQGQHRHHADRVRRAARPRSITSTARCSVVRCRTFL